MHFHFSNINNLQSNKISVKRWRRKKTCAYRPFCTIFNVVSIILGSKGTKFQRNVICQIIVFIFLEIIRHHQCYIKFDPFFYASYNLQQILLQVQRVSLNLIVVKLIFWLFWFNNKTQNNFIYSILFVHDNLIGKYVIFS